MKLFLYSFLFVFQMFQAHILFNSSEELNGQYILQKINFENFFYDYDFSVIQLWFFPDENLLLTNSQMQGLDVSIYISPRNKLTEYNLINNVLMITESNREYNVNYINDQLVLTYIDDPLIDGDKITYYFKKGGAEGYCIKKDNVGLSSPCTKHLELVCGCDGLTYSNPCVATNYGGVNFYTAGACSD